jgi:thiol-disulfide isomerase/thioredoxin
MRAFWPVARRLFVACLVLAGLPQVAASQELGTIQGHIQNVPQGTQVFLITAPYVSPRLVMDSARIDTSGAFRLQTRVSQADVYHLEVGPHVGKYGPPSVGIPLVPGEDTRTEIIMSNDSKGTPILQKVEFSGSEAARALTGWHRIWARYSFQKDSLFSRHPAGAPGKAFQKVHGPFISGAQAYLQQHRADMAGPYVLAYLAGYSELEALQRELIPEFARTQPALAGTRYLLARTESQGALAIGKLAPALQGKRLAGGGQLSLASLRGKYVLIDFWASWCRTCREKHPAMKKVYSKYREKGFEIYAVSVDEDAELWRMAVASDGIDWPQVSDLEGTTGGLGAAYAVDGVPLLVFVDHEGRILSINPSIDEVARVLRRALK